MPDGPFLLGASDSNQRINLLFATFAISGLCLANEECNNTFVFIPLIIAYLASTLLEKIFFISFKHKGKQRVHSIAGLKIIAITASFGKTSIKNYLHHVLKKR